MGVKSHANVRIVVRTERPSLKTPRQAMFQTIEWTPAGTVRLIDQRRLPLEEIYVECRDVAAVADAIRTMQIRGAPAIGVAGAMGLRSGPRRSGRTASPSSSRNCRARARSCSGRAPQPSIWPGGSIG